MVCPVPQLRIQMPKQTAGGRFPGPPKIENHFPEGFEFDGQLWNYVVSLNRRHESKALEKSGKVWQQNEEQQAFRRSAQSGRGRRRAARIMPTTRPVVKPLR